MASSLIPSLPVPVPVSSPNLVVYPAIGEVVLKSEIVGGATTTATIVADAAGASVPLTPSRLALNSLTFTPPANGKLTLTAFANFDAQVNEIRAGLLYFEIDGVAGVSTAWFGSVFLQQRTSATCCEVIEVLSGVPVTIVACASVAAYGGGVASGDYLAYQSRTLIQFT